jgi:hypothetical protein
LDHNFVDPATFVFHGSDEPFYDGNRQVQGGVGCSFLSDDQQRHVGNDIEAAGANFAGSIVRNPRPNTMLVKMIGRPV